VIPRGMPPHNVEFMRCRRRCGSVPSVSEIATTTDASIATDALARVASAQMTMRQAGLFPPDLDAAVVATLEAAIAGEHVGPDLLGAALGVAGLFAEILR